MARLRAGSQVSVNRNYLLIGGGLILTVVGYLAAILLGMPWFVPCVIGAVLAMIFGLGMVIAAVLNVLEDL
jgi:hypothetical protein